MCVFFSFQKIILNFVSDAIAFLWKWIHHQITIPVHINSEFLSAAEYFSLRMSVGIIMGM